MERGDLAAVILGLSLVILLTVILSPEFAHPSQKVPEATPATPVPATPAPPSPGTTAGPPPDLPTPTPVATRRIVYTNDYGLYPVRFLPSDMSTYGYSDAEWRYASSVVFAYVEENHGGITENFTVPYPVWRMTSTLSATKTPENARLRMILVDEKSGLILDGAEIRFSGTVTKTVAARGRPLYMVIAAEKVDSFMITLEAPSVFVE